MSKKFAFTTLLLALIAMFTACGEGGTTYGDNSSAPVINGTVATGAPLVADIVVMGTDGYRTAVSTSDGSYFVDVRGLTSPFVIRAKTADGKILYSAAKDGQIQANITPLSSYILHQIAVNNGLLGGAWQIFADVSGKQNLLSQLDSETNALNTLLNTSMQAANVSGFNHIADAFLANSTGYDAYLDSLDIEIDNDNIIIKDGTTTLHTLSYTLPTGTITTSGKVVDQNGSAISGATLSFTNAQGNFSTTTSADGSFSLALTTHRVFDLNVSASGYRSVVYYNIPTFSQTPITIETVSLIANAVTGDGTVEGSVINARTVQPLTGVTLKFRKGINNTGGTVVHTANVSSDGNYSIPVPTGVYTITYEKEGFTNAQRSVTVIGGQTSQVQAVPMITSTVGGNSFATMILTWGENPNDLDTFLTGPSAVLDSTATLSGDRFKLAYYQKTFSTRDGYAGPAVGNKADPCSTPTLVAGIDVDDVSSYGPETTTLCQVEAGTYSYYIHHFSGLSSMSDSPAVVTVTTASGVSTAFIAPPGAAGVNTDIWHVFDLDNYGNLTPVNTMGSGGTGSVFSPALNGTDIDQTLIDRSYEK